jgi:transcriptional regulator with XRE-family HTH domain
MAIKLVPRRLIGPTIRGIRNRLGQTQDEFAESIGVGDGSTVSAWENGEAQPDYGMLAKIAAMGLVDVLVFSDTSPDAETPQLTPGEAGELRGILARMEALVAEAREIVERASDRTVLETLETAVGPRATLPEVAEGGRLRAELTVEAEPLAGSGRGAGNGRSGARGGRSAKSSSSASGAPDTGSGGSSRSRGGGGTSRSGGGSKSGSKGGSKTKSSGGSSSASSRGSSSPDSASASSPGGSGSSSSSRGSGSRGRSGGKQGSSQSGASS